MLNNQNIAADYEAEYLHYRNYHQNKWNNIIHMITIPLEWLGWVLWLSVLSLHFPFCFGVAIQHFFLPQQLAFVVGIVHVVYAMVAEVVKRRLRSSLTLIKIGLALQVVSWFLQVIVGHFCLEKNNPSFVKKFTLTGIIFSVMISWDRQTLADETKEFNKVKGM
jgi:uncharacterized membrane protein YGL010W